MTAYLEETYLTWMAKIGAQLEETAAQQEETAAQQEETAAQLEETAAQQEETRVHNLRRRAQLEETKCTT